MVSTRAVLALVVLVVVLAALSPAVSAGYRKPPFNGSIFGKRAGAETGTYESGKGLVSACQLAMEACAAWLPEK